MDRRDFLSLTALVAAGVGAAACTPAARQLAGRPAALLAEPLPGNGLLPVGSAASREFALLNRLTFGPTAESLHRLAEIGPAGWIEEQLAPQTIDDPAQWRLRPLDMIRMDPPELIELGDKLFDDIDPSPVLDQLRRATLIRQVHSRRQLYETMVEFWTDHFNIAVNKGDCWFLKVVDDREVIRRHALGNFRQLLHASASSPAMLVYLDNQVNHRQAPNENYAREVMELHTLGVDGGYSQRDVMELARCLTGWTVKERWWRGQFTFDQDAHDPGPKQLLGSPILGTGQAEAANALDRLAAHPATASFIAGKLVRRFVCDDPAADAPDLVARTADAFLRSDGDIQTALRVVLLDGLLKWPVRSGSPWLPAKFKRPAAFVASAVRALGGETNGGPAVQQHLRVMGHLPFGWPTPDGPPDVATAWAFNLMPRWQAAIALATGEIKGVTVRLEHLVNMAPDELLDQLASALLGAPLASSQRSGLLAELQNHQVDPASLPSLLAAGIMASPAFQWR